MNASAVRLQLTAEKVAEQVAEKRAGIDPMRAVLTALFAVPFLLGWLVGVCWSALAWSWAAVVVGFQTSQSGRSSEEPTT